MENVIFRWAEGLGGLWSSYMWVFIIAGIASIYFLFKKPIYSLGIFIIVGIGIPIFQGYRYIEQVNTTKHLIGNWSSKGSPHFEFKITKTGREYIYGIITSDFCEIDKVVHGAFKSSKQIYLFSHSEPMFNFTLSLNDGLLSGNLRGCEGFDDYQLSLYLSKPVKIKCNSFRCESIDQ